MKNVLIAVTLVLLGFALGKFNTDDTERSAAVESEVISQQAETQEVRFPQMAAKQETSAAREKTEEVMPETTEAQMDPLVADFVATGNPQQVMDFYKQRRAARAEMLQRHMSQENLDERWSKELTEQYSTAKALVPGLNKLDLATADCRETICALQFDFTSNTQYREVRPLMANIGNVLGSDAFVHHDALPHGAIIYVSRGESPLPDLENTVGG